MRISDWSSDVCSSDLEQFGNIILRAESDGTTVRLKDVARVEKGASTYGFDLQWSGTPASGFAIQLAPGANALGVAGAVSERMDELQATFPEGVTWFSPYDSSTFVETSIIAVVETLFERSEEHTSELQSLMRISYAVFCLKKKKK